MIYLVQFIREDGTRSSAFPIDDLRRFVKEMKEHSEERGDWEEFKKQGLLFLLVIDEDDSFRGSRLPVYSFDLYFDRLVVQGMDLPDMQLTDFLSMLKNFNNEVIA